MKSHLVVFIFLFLLISCTSNHSGNRGEAAFHLDVPSTFDSLPTIPDDNVLTKNRIALGKRLFFDKRLSGNGEISCGTCHQKERAYADSKPFTQNIHADESPRNAPTLINVAYQKRLFASGGIHNLETQFLAPFVNKNEMNFSINDGVAILKLDTAYVRMAHLAYGKDLDAYMIAKAISSFERSLISTGSDFDAFQDGRKDALGAAEIRGMKLFYSDRVKCGSCHTGFLFTDQDYHNIGLYTRDSDEGRAQITLDTNDIGKFKTPPLRNIALTAPYMHDGSFETLTEVLDHYNRGGENNKNKDARIDSLRLTKTEMDDIISFLNSLTDHRIPG